MRIIPSTVATVTAEIEDHALLAELLQADIPADWPPEEAADALAWFKNQLETKPELDGWFGWYGIATDLPDGRDVLVTGGGYAGLPVEGSVEIGYSSSPTYYRKGYASEMMAALTARALRLPEVYRVFANVNEDNVASIGLLKKIGFQLQGPGAEANQLQFAITEADLAENI
ncbi:MAG: GNAT family N-acetyltransferase [Chthonomonadales bacterium]